jgi:NAD(P)-dependent dehydrogenase (short-subunit alcohol dehydrogenase family)
MEKTAKTPPTVNSVTPRTWIISGAAGGIGRCLVWYLVKNNQRVIGVDKEFSAPMLQQFETCTKTRVCVHDLDDSSSDHLSEQIEFKNLILAKCDLVNYSSRSKLGSWIHRNCGTIDVLINNAAAFDDPKDPWNLDNFESILQVNLHGPFHLIQGLQGIFQPHGSIVNICSTRAHQSQPNTPGYSASKGGLLALTHSLAVTLGPRIRVNAISPGWIDTRGCGFDQDFFEDDSMLSNSLLGSKPDYSTSDEHQHPAGRVGNPMDVIRGIMYLTDPGNTFVTGQELIIDGGMTKQMIYHGDGGWFFEL